MPRVYLPRSIGHWAPVPAERIGCPQPYGQLDVHLPGQVACFPCSSGKGMRLACRIMSFPGSLACNRPAGLRKALEQLSAKPALSAVQHRVGLLRGARTIQKTTTSPESGVSVVTVAVLACRRWQPCVWQGSPRISGLALSGEDPSLPLCLVSNPVCRRSAITFAKQPKEARASLVISTPDSLFWNEKMSSDGASGPKHVRAVQ